MKRHTAWVLPIVSILLILPFTPAIDLFLARFFYQPALLGKGSFVDNEFTKFFYRYGEYPAFLLGSFALLVFVASFIFKKVRVWRRGAFACGLVLFLGSGLVVNLLLKEHIQRPRPKQIEECGGKYQFRAVYNFHPIAKQNEDGQKSFPSGHATMGFYFLSLIVVGIRYQNRKVIIAGIVLTLVLGVGLSIVRIMQGGHFFSDTLFSAFIMWNTTLIVDRLVLRNFIKERVSQLPKMTN